MDEKMIQNENEFYEPDAKTLLAHEKLRSEVLSYMVDHDDDPIELLKNFAERLRVLINCDQVIYRDLEETRIMVNSPAIEKTWSVPIEYCMQCEHFDAHHPMYAGGYTEMDNCQEGWQGIPVYKDCPIKSSLTRIVYIDGEIAGYLAIHYVQNYHSFTETERRTLEEFTRILSISLSRYTYKQKNTELDSIKRNMNMVFSLSGEYDPIIVLDPETGEYDWFMSMASDVEKNTSMTTHGEDIYQNVGIDGSTIIHEEDREQFKKFYSKENMLSLAKSGEIQEIENRWWIAEENRYRWKYNKAVRMIDENGKARIVVGVMDTTKKKESQLGAVPLSPDVLNKAHIGMWAFELDEGKEPRMYVDTAMLALLGLEHQISPEETYHAWYDFVDEDSYGLVSDAVEKMASGEHAEVQYPWHHPDGHTMVVRCGGTRNFEYKKGIRIEGTHQDVSQTLHYDDEKRKRAKLLENELVKSKLRADSLAYIEDNEPDLDNAIQFFGKRILEISGCDQVIFRDIYGHRTVLNAPGISDVSSEVCEKCPFSKFDTEMYKDGYVLMNDSKDGNNGIMPHPECPVKSSFMQQVYLSGKLVGLLSVHYLREQHTFMEYGIDIMKTIAVYFGLLIGRIEAKQTEQERMKAEASSKAKTDFLFNMSHDIRTPMNAIIGFTDKAIRHKKDEKVLTETLEKIKASGDYLLQLVNDILDMARIEAGKLEIKEELTCSAKDENMLLEIFGAEAARKDITLHTSYNNKDEYVWLDKIRVNQIVANLLSNAIKYTEPGGDIWYSVEQVHTEKEGYGKFICTIKDTGRGMSAEFVEKIFNAFEREQTSTNSGVQGTGLGMAIVKRIVDALQGSIEVQSEPGKGTAVILTTEFRIATPEEIAEYKALKEQDYNEEDISFEGRRILLVEDNDFNREIATDILEDENLVVESAENGQVAVDMIKEKGPDYYDFVLMDIQMPVMNGYEATKAIRGMYPVAKLPIIALSANAFAEDKAESLKAGMDDHVSKPIEVEELFAVLSKFV